MSEQAPELPATVNELTTGLSIFTLFAWTPRVVCAQEDTTCDAFGQVLVKLIRCATCERWMFYDLEHVHNLFPSYSELTLQAQAVRAGWRVVSGARAANGETICTECRDAGKAAFRCYRCACELPSNLLQRSFGNPPDHLCAECYATAPAKEWQELVKQLKAQHRYDDE